MNIFVINSDREKTLIEEINVSTGKYRAASTTGRLKDQASTIANMILGSKPEKVIVEKLGVTQALLEELINSMQFLGLELKEDGTVVYQSEKAVTKLHCCGDGYSNKGRTISEILNEYNAFSAMHLEIILNMEETQNALNDAELLENPIYTELVNEHIEKIGNQNKARIDKISNDATEQYVKYLESGLKSIILAYQPEITELTTHEELINEVNRTEYLKKYWIEFYESEIANAKKRLNK